MTVTDKQTNYLIKWDKVRASRRNFDEEFKTKLWETYHFLGTNKYKFLYYDPK